MRTCFFVYVKELLRARYVHGHEHGCNFSSPGLLVLIDLAEKLYHIEKFVISFYAICYEKLSCLIKKFCKPVEKNSI